MGKFTIVDDGPFDVYCPKCGSQEWDRITDRVAPGESFQRCGRCDNEWHSDKKAGMPCVAPPHDIPMMEAPSYYCRKCSYSGPVQVGHQRPNGTGVCGYIAQPSTAPKQPKCSRCNGERTIDQTGYGEYRPCPECNPESPYYEYPLP